MNSSNIKVSDYLSSISGSLILIDSLTEDFFDSYSDNFTRKTTKNLFKAAVNNYLHICLTTKDTETGELLIFFSQYGSNFKDMLSDGIAHKIYAILKDNNEKPIYDSGTLKAMAMHFVMQLRDLLLKLAKKA